MVCHCGFGYVILLANLMKLGFLSRKHDLILKLALECSLMEEFDLFEMELIELGNSVNTRWKAWGVVLIAQEI